MSDGLPIRGARVVLRRCAVGDLAAFQAYRSDPEVARYQSWEAMSDEAARGFLAHCAEVTPLLRPGHWMQVALADPESDALLGDMGLFLSADGRAAEVGVTLAGAAQGRGRAREALGLAVALIFERTEAQVIHGIADIRNHKSLVLLERAGFRAVKEETTTEGGESFTERFHVLER